MARLIHNIMTQPSALVWRLAFATLLWWILTEGNASSWMIGLPSVCLAVILSFQLSPAGVYQIRLVALPGFLVYFFYTSLTAGMDIARRTLSRPLRIGSNWVKYETTLSGLPRWLFMSSLSLMPGTLSVNLENQRLLIHSLDNQDTTLASLHQLERNINALFVKRESV